MAERARPRLGAAVLAAALAGCGGSGATDGSEEAAPPWAGVGMVEVAPEIAERVERRFRRRGEEPPPTAYRAVSRPGVGEQMVLYTHGETTAGLLVVVREGGGSSSYGLRVEVPAAGLGTTAAPPGFQAPLPGGDAAGGQTTADDCTIYRLATTRSVIVALRLSGGPATLLGVSLPWRGRGLIQETPGASSAVAAPAGSGSVVVQVVGTDADRMAVVDAIDLGALATEVADLERLGPDGNCPSG